MTSFFDPEQVRFIPGMRVRAAIRITEADVPPNPAAGPCQAGWVHCQPGDLGEVILVVDAVPTVAFEPSGTATVCGPFEVIPVIPEAADPVAPFPLDRDLARVVAVARAVATEPGEARSLAERLGLTEDEVRRAAWSAAFAGFVDLIGDALHPSESGQLLAHADDETARALFVGALHDLPAFSSGTAHVITHGALPRRSQVARWLGAVDQPVDADAIDVVLGWLAWLDPERREPWTAPAVRGEA